jgi:hypothetical protein
MLASTFAVVFIALYVGHQVGDHWVQSDHQASTKGCKSHAGRMACLAHVATLHLTIAAALTAVALVLSVDLSPTGLTVGLTVNAISHYWADRRFTLEKLAAKLDRTRFFALGKPRKVAVYNPATGERMIVVKVTDAGLPELNKHGQVVELPVDNPSLGAGAYALDQSWHMFWLLVSALLIVAL